MANTNVKHECGASRTLVKCMVLMPAVALLRATIGIDIGKAIRMRSSEGRAMGTFVLVHGAWHGSWCWKRVRRMLQQQGHEVFTPTLTGVGERSHLLNRDLNLETHILDVQNLIVWEELSDVVLCGHSYGGCVVTGVADRVPERVRALVYLDAFVLEAGQSLAQLLPQEQYRQPCRRDRCLRRRMAGSANRGCGISGQSRRSRVGRSPVHEPPAEGVPAAASSGRRDRCDPGCYLQSGRRIPGRLSISPVL